MMGAVHVPSQIDLQAMQDKQYASLLLHTLAIALTTKDPFLFFLPLLVTIPPLPLCSLEGASMQDWKKG